MAGVNLQAVFVARGIDANVDPLNGAKFYVFQAGTSTPVSTFSDLALTSANAHPVVADANGAWGAIYAAVGTYKIDITNSAGTSQPGYPVDNVRFGTTIDINGLAALTAPAASDEFMIYDDSAGGNRKIVPEDLLKIISVITSLTAPAVADELVVYDASESDSRRITLTNFFKVINLLTAETAPAIDDEIAIYDASALTADKMTLQNMLKVINSLSADASPDGAADYLLSYDTSTSTARRVLMNALPGGSFASALFHVRDQKTAGTDGGTFTQGAWQTRVLQTSLTNEITDAALASNQITLPLGTYYIEAEVPMFSQGASHHKAKLYDTTGSANLLIGTTMFYNSDSDATTQSIIRGRFTLSEESVLEIRHQTALTQSTNGFGGAANFSVVEVYTDVRIWKIG